MGMPLEPVPSLEVGKAVRISSPRSSPTSVTSAFRREIRRSNAEGFPTLVEMVDLIWDEIQPGNKPQPALKDLLKLACAELGVDPTKRGFVSQARQCYAQLLPTATAHAVQPMNLRLSIPQRAADDESCSGRSLTERSDRSVSTREAPPSARLKLSPSRLSSPRIWRGRLPSPTAAVAPSEIEVIRI